MGRRTLLNLLLLGAVAALGLVVWLEPGLDEGPQRPPLTGLAREAVTRITVTYPDRPDLVLERRGEDWDLASPYGVPANAFRVAALLDLLDTPSRGEVAAAAADPARFGLDPPRAVVRFDDLAVAFGDTQPIDGRRYVRVGDTVQLVDDRVFYHLEAGADGFVDLALLGPGADPVAVDLGELRVQRGADGWRAQPAGVSPAAAADLAAAWAGARAIAVRPHETVGEADQTVTVTPADGKTPVTFRVQREGSDTLFVRPDKGLAWVVPDRQAERLLEPGAETEGDETAHSTETPPSAAGARPAAAEDGG